MLSAASPLHRRLLAWANERFPLAETAVMLLAFYGTGLLYGRALTDDGELWLEPGDAAGLLAVWSFFLMMRVLDEHKDFEHDRVAHPQRVLQRGLVTLAHLRVLGAAAIAVQLAVCLLLDGGAGLVTAWWLITMAFIALTVRELFAGAWLNRGPTRYAMAHLPLWSLALQWMAQMGAREESLPAGAAWLALLGFLLPFGIEVARRVEPAALQEPGATSYADVLGAGRTALLLGGIVTGGAVTAAAMLAAADALSAVPAVLLALGPIAAAAALPRFRRDPLSRAANRSVKAAVRLGLLSQLVVITATLIASR